MKEILKSKVMILFITMVLGLTYFDSLNCEKLEERSEQHYGEVVLNSK